MLLSEIQVGRVYRYCAGTPWQTDYRVLQILDDEGWEGYIEAVEVSEGPFKGNAGILLPHELEEVD